MVDAAALVIAGVVLGFAVGAGVVWCFGSSRAFAKGFEAGYLHAVADAGDLVVRVRKEVLK